jgi:serine/threonine-protein kinase RsbW
VHFDITSDYAAAARVLDAVVLAVEKKGYDADSVFGIKLALDEALVNAIKHGNKLDHTKCVRIDVKMTPRRLEIEVEDQGKGFDRKMVPDPREAANIEKPSGRGILLIESYMNKVQWKHGGRCLRMVKLNDGGKVVRRR